MWMLLRNRMLRCGWALEGDMSFRPPSGPPQAVPARPPESKISTAAITEYHDQTQDPMQKATADVQHEASWDLLALSYTDGLSNDEVNKVTAMYDKVEAGQTLTAGIVS